MEKEKVLEIEIIKINEKYSAWHITYQNEKILKRGEFEDRELKVYSVNFLDFNTVTKSVYIRGKEKEDDNSVSVIPNECVEILKSKVDAINEKYGIPKRWRAEEGSAYYFIDLDGKIKKEKDYNYLSDCFRYELGNYFKTEEEAEKIVNSKEWKDFWAKVRAGEIGGDE